jgi:CBS domain-containing protein
LAHRSLQSYLQAGRQRAALGAALASARRTTSNLERERKVDMNVESLMTKDPKCCRADESLRTAAYLMWECDIGSLPVVDQEHRVIGMITDRDICMAGYFQDRPLSDIRVHQAMASKIVACRPEDDVTTAERLMRDNQIRRLPIIDRQGHLMGVVSVNDLARKAASDRHLSSPRVGETGVVTTMAAIASPRPLAVAS